MARDRQRAKQRRDRRRRAGLAETPAGHDPEITLEHDDPMAHGSADVDLAHAQVALGRPEGEVDDDELEEEADAAAGTPVPRDETSGGVALSGGNRVIGFLRASWRELQRVQWPDRKQVAQATGVVLGFVIIAGLYLGLADEVAKQIVKAIIP